MCLKMRIFLKESKNCRSVWGSAPVQPPPPNPALLLPPTDMALSKAVSSELILLLREIAQKSQAENVLLLLLFFTLNCSFCWWGLSEIFFAPGRRAYTLATPLYGCFI